jgi:hypothetical protein
MHQTVGGTWDRERAGKCECPRDNGAASRGSTMIDKASFKVLSGT